MKKCIFLLLLILGGQKPFAIGKVQAALGTAFSYQGRLLDNGMPAQGPLDFQFRLFADATLPNNAIASLIKTNVTSTNGLFSLDLDFGETVFNGESRWLEVTVRPNGTQQPYQPLGPRQAILPVPYAIYTATAAQALTALNVPWSGITQLPTHFAGAGAGLSLEGTNLSVAPGGIVHSMMASGAVGSANVQDRAITNAKLAENSVTRDKISAGQMVKSVNDLTDDIELVAGENISLEVSTNSLMIAATNVWQLNGNQGTTDAQFLGTRDFQPLELRANNQRILLLEPHNTAPNLIGGASDNSIINGTFGVTIAGGQGNRVTDPYGTVNGGFQNQAGSDDDNLYVGRSATVGGGRFNIASGEESTVAGGRNNIASGEESVVGGGRANQAVGYAAVVAGGGGYNATLGLGVPNHALGFWSAIGGGSDNLVTNEHGTIAGGENNRSAAHHSAIGGGKNNSALANYATVPGGFWNSAQGAASLAAGTHAQAQHAGSFVWADYNTADFNSATPNEFAVRCTGGARFVTSLEVNPSGVLLAAGGGSWSTLSDRQAKENFEPVDPVQVLEQLAALPIATWNYKTQDPSIRHLGVTAQDFARAFKVGEDNQHINTVDADGVALAAIQGLYTLLQEKEAQIQSQQQQIQALRNRLNHWEQSIQAFTNQLKPH